MAFLLSLAYFFTPSLSTIVMSSAGSILVKWGFEKYIKSNENYYYIYQIASNYNQPYHLSQLFVQTFLPSLPSTEAIAETSTSIKTFLIFTVNQAGNFAYRILENLPASSPWLQAPKLSLLTDQFFLNEIQKFEQSKFTKIDLNKQIGCINDDEQTKKLLASWSVVSKDDIDFHSEPGDDPLDFVWNNNNSKPIYDDFVVDDDYLGPQDSLQIASSDVFIFNDYHPPQNPSSCYSFSEHDKQHQNNDNNYNLYVENQRTTPLPNNTDFIKYDYHEEGADDDDDDDEVGYFL